MNGISHRTWKNSGFTLLELLVVVAILAIIGGGLLVAYDQVDDRAAEGTAAHTLAVLDKAVRTYTAMERGMPNGLDSLLSADPGNVQGSPDKVAILPSKLLGSKTLLVALTQAQLDALTNAGLTDLRYVDASGCDPANPPPGTGATVTLAINDADGNSAVVGALLEIDIPHRIFETPRPGTGRNRGRGFVQQLAVGDPVLRWNPSRSGGTGNYDNTKLGADPDDVLLIFGLGNDASIIGAGRGRAQMPAAPVFGKGLRYEYGRYLLVYNLGPLGREFETAQLQTVLNTHGDFIDEMLAEHGGQKQ